MKDTILIVDDEKILMLMDNILSKRYDTLVARDGKEGLEVFKENSDKIKLVITDEMMPNMTGSQMMQEIIKINPNVLVVFVTGKNDVNYSGGHHLIQKPFNIPDLINTVDTLLGSYHTGNTKVFRKKSTP